MDGILKGFGFGTERGTDLAALILRVSLAILFVAHAGLKIFVFTPAGTVGYFQSLGLPGFLAYVTIAAELLGAVALAVGFQTTLVALALIPIMVGATYLGHGSAGFYFTNQGGGWEFPAFWTVTLLVQALIGGGKYTVAR